MTRESFNDILFLAAFLWRKIMASNNTKAEHLPAKVPERVQQAVPEEPPQVQEEHLQVPEEEKSRRGRMLISQ